jgi:enoyl-CoA hydratase/carnithine racemase
MPPTFTPAAGLLAELDLLSVSHAGALTHVRLDRPAKRNALSDTLIQQLHSAFVNLPESTRAVVLSGEGDHFSAGLDLSELMERDAASGVLHSRMWHAAFDQVQFGRVPVVAVLHGAVVGGGLGLAKGIELAGRIATNAPMSNYAVMHALPRIADQSMAEGLLTESLMAAVAESTPEAKERLRAFLDKRAGKVVKK